MPLIVSWPARVAPAVSDAIVSQVDLFASIAALIGQPMPQDGGADGQDVLPALLGQSSQGREYVIQEALTQLAVRQGNWKYIPPGSITQRGGIGEWIETQVDAPGWLFNLANDPAEQKNVAALHPEKVVELRQVILKVAPEKATGNMKTDKKQLGF